jgi:hypothetical protein
VAALATIISIERIDTAICAAGSFSNRLLPNTALQLIASREIVGILEASAGALAATECQAVGLALSMPITPLCLSRFI